VSLLARHRRKSFLWQIVTEDEKWINFENTHRKKSWVNARSPTISTPKKCALKKAMLCIWWDSKGLLFYEMLKPGETVTTNLYKGQLHKLNEKIQELRPHDAYTPRKVLLLHDNARPRIAIATKEAISELGWEPLPHPEYSPDLAQPDYHLFRSLQRSMSQQSFKNDEEVENRSIFSYHPKKNPFSVKVYISCPKVGQSHQFQR